MSGSVTIVGTMEMPNDVPYIKQGKDYKNLMEIFDKFEGRKVAIRIEDLERNSQTILLKRWRY